MYLNNKQLLLFNWYVNVRNKQYSFADMETCDEFIKICKQFDIDTSKLSINEIIEQEFQLTIAKLDELAKPYIWYLNLE